MMIKCFFVVLAIIASTLGGMVLAETGMTPINQTLALQHLYDSTNGPEWVYNGGDPWNFSQPLELTKPCDGWDGVTCHCVEGIKNSSVSNITCNIVELSMFWVYLDGTLPSTLNMLQHLSLLNLGFNSLTGTIPPELFSLTELVDLDLGYNFLTGTLPQEVTQLRNLNNQFSLFFNFLSGTIPSGINNWPYLKV